MDKRNLRNIILKVQEINGLLSADNQIAIGFREGRGYYIELPDNIFTSILDKKKYYITSKTFSNVNFILKKFDLLMKFESDMATILLDALEE